MNDLFQGVYQHETARVYGDAQIGVGSSLWINAAIRAEMHRVRIGKYSNIQDFVMLHVGMRTDTIIGDYCSVAHRAVVHGATIGDNCLIGVGAIVMDGCIVGDNSIVDAGVCLPPGTTIAENSIVQGASGATRRTRNNFVVNRMNAIYYNINAEHYQRGEHRAWADETVKKRMKAYFRMLSAQARASSAAQGALDAQCAVSRSYAEV